MLARLANRGAPGPTRARLFLARNGCGTLVPRRLPPAAGSHLARRVLPRRQGGCDMAVKVLELHHHGVCMHPSMAERMKGFYENVLGLKADAGRPDIPGIPGYWMDLPDDTQIHLMGKE